MYAIIETGGKQFWVTPGETIRVEKLDAEAGQELTFKALWAVGDAKDGRRPWRGRSCTRFSLSAGLQAGTNTLSNSLCATSPGQRPLP
jgi:hypothetical protein